MLTSAFWRPTLRHAIMTFVQVMVTVMIGAAADLFDKDWVFALVLACVAAVAAIVACIVVFLLRLDDPPGRVHSELPPTRDLR